MAITYKPPGAYVEEIPILRPDVAQVETAIPAFIGYTARASNLSPDDLRVLPKRIGSLVEYEQFYGKGPSPEISEVNINAKNEFISASVCNKFFMYDALQMFYANGGGDCYIVSIGASDKSTSIDKNDFLKGIDALEKEDAPTLILFPDVATLSGDNTFPVQQAALLQCSKLQDRFCILDVKEKDPLGENLRDTIGINNLNYGAAYTPWLKVNLPKTISYKDLGGVIKKENIHTTVSGLTLDTDVLAIITSLEKAHADQEKIAAKTAVLNVSGGSLSARFVSLLTDFNASSGNSDANLKNLFNYLYSIATQIDQFVNDPANALSLVDLVKNLKSSISSDFDKLFASVVGLEHEVKDKITDTTYTPSDFRTLVANTSSWPLSTTVTESADINEANDNDRRTAAANRLEPVFDQINIAYENLVVNTAATQVKTLNDTLLQAFPVYKNIINGVSNALTTTPPGGAIAGVYAQVDGARGVWKAPANISLNNVIAPAVVFSASELDGLNVDTVSGKSINAIRAFSGKGTLVWGARTLAGNDNEWRYISVRRFFIMVEESARKATEPFVFEPNDANSWIKIQGMLENYLTTLWRAGALQGAKPEHAFYVAVGLNKTMTALDILEGRLIVEIGMAVVRPAEFIILRFSHKLAESS